MVGIRLRHPTGVATLQVSLDSDEFTVQDLQQEIYAVTKILPSRQNLKAGYPPHELTLIPELPIDSLGIKVGEQIIVSERPGAAARSSTVRQSQPAPAAAVQTRSPVSAPSPSPRPPQPQSISGPDYVETDGGVLIHRFMVVAQQVVPDDNSCLFSAVALLFEQSIDKAPEMRKIVAQAIRDKPETYTEAILGYVRTSDPSACIIMHDVTHSHLHTSLLIISNSSMPPDKYIATILKPSTWGGAIELTILAAHYNTEIASVDVETGRIDHFAPGTGATGGMRCVLVYSGIHYDAATLAPMPEAPGEWHQAMFPVTSSDEQDPVMLAAKKLADVLRAKRAYTNTATFDLKCEVCGQGLKGEKGAREHAEQTGHVRFGEY
ncbi:hypothetical protein H0H81_009849 [Sphagnurus paluster]|uniref:Ubiquitin thioesterase OTU n=1 Tax=Sphagnurus paluster TaxID=117069 RepID=A0A9P7K5J3_9AGAR|nr:hypothetical protein H0H81_009849 [Sphagnurus paluster]